MTWEAAMARARHMAAQTGHPWSVVGYRSTLSRGWLYGCCPADESRRLARRISRDRS